MSSASYRKGRAKIHQQQAQFANLLGKEPAKQPTSLLAHRHQISPNLIPLQFYFDPKERKKLVHSVIDGYLQNTRNTQISCETQETNGASNLLSIRKFKSSQESKKRNLSATERNLKVSQAVESRITTMRGLSNKSISEFKDKSLPTIEEFIEPRPQTENKRRKLTSQHRSATTRVIPSKHFEEAPSEKGWMNFEQNDSSTSIDISEINGTPNRSYFGEGTESMYSKVSISSTSSFFKCKYFEYDRQTGTQHIIKKYSEPGHFLYTLQLKAKKLGAAVLWENSVFDNQLIYSYENFPKPLEKELYYKVKSQHGSEPVTKIYPKKEMYEGLFKNDCEWLKDIIVGICQQLKDLRGKVTNNKITLSNVCRKGEKQVYLMDWSASALREKLTTLDKHELVKYTAPTLKEEQSVKNSKNRETKWLCQPEYLAPELIAEFIALQKMPEEQMWGKNGEHSWRSDIWSLGCMLFQILTLVPLSTNERTSVKGRNVFRRGLLPLVKEDFVTLERKQNYLSNQAQKIVKRECGDLLPTISPKIIVAMEGMLKFDRNERLTPEEVIKILSM